VKRLKRWLFGVRDDLNLDQRWWHRLMLVGYILTTIGIALFVGFLSHRQPTLNRDNIAVIATLGDYTTRHPELENSVPSFVVLGRVAFESPSGTLEDYFRLEYEYFCSAELSAHPQELAAFLRRADAAYREMDAERAAQWLRDHGAAGEVGNCIARRDNDLPGSSKIIAYRFATDAVAREIAKAALWAIGGALVWSFITLNGYYRGLVYVIFGSRRKAAAEPEVKSTHGPA
jgi:hypothetical protein